MKDYCADSSIFSIRRMHIHFAQKGIPSKWLFVCRPHVYALEQTRLVGFNFSGGYRVSERGIVVCVTVNYKTRLIYAHACDASLPPLYEA